MEPDEVRRRVAAARIGRLATVRPDGTPHIVPICFAVLADAVVTGIDEKPKTTTNLQRLTNVRAKPNVSVLVDHYEEDWSRIWWARVDGRARVLQAGAEHEEALTALRAKYAQYQHVGIPGTMLAIDVERWRGWAYSG